MKMNTILKLFLICGMFSFLAACGSKLSSDNFALIKNGMTQEEVRDLIGKPDSVKSDEMLGLSSTVYTYQEGETEAKVGFINGKVTHKSGKFEQ